jgi:hypothetical protein
VATTPYRFGPKHPATQNDPFEYDLTAWLGKSTITGTVTATSTPAGLTIGTVECSGSIVTVYVSDGIDGTDYQLAINVSAVDPNGNSRGPVAIGAMVLCTSPVPAQ